MKKKIIYEEKFEYIKKLIKNDLNKILKNKIFYLICILLLINIFGQLFINITNKLVIPEAGIDTYISELAKSNITIILCILLIGKIIINEFKSNELKRIFQKGITGINFFLGKVISVYIITISIYLIYILIKVIINSIESGVGFGSISAILFDTILKLIFILALITIFITVSLLVKNYILGGILFLCIINISTILFDIFSLVGININLNWINMLNYVNKICVESINHNILLLIGIMISILYIIVFGMLGLLIADKSNKKYI
ncbi:ABC transporter permease [uncultured Clostridium sp.]|uniref:ABC transporter permease n=1 Tax=uncultured Clostridium sp. TaxID=59620 RepID=UPI002614FCD7|nr:ABC transporter permease [uncultured Clostridium sp.]